MSSSRPSSAAGPAGTSRHRLAAASAALAGLALLGACGTVSAQSAGSTSPIASTSAAPSTTTPAPTPTPTPTPGSTGAGALRVRVPLVLPAEGGQLSGEVTGVVTIGLNQCLFLRTDAGQRFGLVGTLADHVRTLLIARMVPLAVGADPGPSALTGSYGVRVQARGSVTTGASVCSSPYDFRASAGAVDGGVTPLR